MERMLSAKSLANVAAGGLMGAATPGFGPTGWLLGKGGGIFGFGSKSGVLDSYNIFRFGWTYNGKVGKNVLSIRGRTAKRAFGQKHNDMPGRLGIGGGANASARRLVLWWCRITVSTEVRNKLWLRRMSTLEFPSGAPPIMKQFIGWFASKKFSQTKIQILHVDSHHHDEDSHYLMKMKPEGQSKLSIDLTFTADGFVGFGIYFVDDESKPYLWGFEPSFRSNDFILFLCELVSNGNVSIVFTMFHEWWRGALGYLEIDGNIYDSTIKQYFTKEAFDIRRKGDTRCVRNRYCADPWQRFQCRKASQSLGCQK